MNSPLALRFTAVFVGLESLLLLVVAVWGLIDPSNLGVALGLGILYLVGAIGLAMAGIGLWERRSWGRAPVVLAQLVILGIAWDVHDHSIGISIVAATLAGAVLVGVLQPASTRALGGDS